MQARPLILVTNDDGWNSPGLIVAAEAVSDLGDLLLVSPYAPQDSTARAVLGGPTTGIIRHRTINVGGKQTLSYSVEGTPSLVVSHAVLEIADRKPVLCVSGINDGENIGRSASISGTIGAAFEADSYGIPGIAVSLEKSQSEPGLFATTSPGMQAAGYFAHLIARQVRREGFPAGVSVLNVNVPSCATTSTEMRMTAQSSQNYYEFASPGNRRRNQPFQLEFVVDFAEEGVEVDSDIRALAVDRVISVTPMTWSMTAAVDWKAHD